ncbi:MAG: Na+/H+ antiporter NhaA [Bacteroidota bacterium]
MPRNLSKNKQQLTKLLREFFDSEKAAGLVLVVVTFVSLALANSPWKEHYIGFWNMGFHGRNLVYWINDGLMAIFFLLIGLELEREVYQGELSDIKSATLPLVGALGGMLIPVAIYFVFNWSSGTKSGSGIPMATDIAFAVGILSLLGKRVTVSLKIFLTALAVIDDLGAIVVIAIFYSSSLAVGNLLIAFGIFGFLILLNRLKVRNLIPYLIGGGLMWYFMLHSGVHAAITGVLLAFAIPFGKLPKKSPSSRLQHFLHVPVAFIILPLFAMANTCIWLGPNWHGGLFHSNSLGIMAGLVIGKPLGIFLFTFIGVGLGICKLPTDLKWKNIIGAGFLGGIGFTMSIFITLLAFHEQETIINSKIAIIVASIVASFTGFIWLKLSLKK